MQLTLEQKLGQLLMFGFPAEKLGDAEIQLIEKYKAGNVILFARNLTSPKQMKELCDDIKKRIYEQTGLLPFIGIDQEGGVVSRVPNGATIFPSAMAVAAAGSTSDAKLAAYYSAKELAALGVNCNFAPVADVNTNEQNPVIGVRSYGNTVQKVVPFMMAVQEGIIKAGLLPSTKHFPGHGDTFVDSHLGLPSVDKSKKQLEECELAPFAHAIKNGTPCIMASHMLFPAYDNSGVPASLSAPILQGLLRGEMGFDGLIVSDCLEMGAIKDYFGTSEAFLMGIKAGLDIGCISHEAHLAVKAMQLTMKAIEDKSLPMQRVDDAVQRIIKAKKHFANANAPFECVNCKEHKILAQNLMLKAITRFDDNGNLPKIDENTLFISTRKSRATMASTVVLSDDTFAEKMAEEFKGQAMVLSLQPDENDINTAFEKAKQYKTIVIGTFNAHLNKEQITLVNKISRHDAKIVVVAMRNPYDLLHMPQKTYKLAAYEYSTRSFEAVKAVLKGEKAQGTNKHII